MCPSSRGRTRLDAARVDSLLAAGTLVAAYVFGTLLDPLSELEAVQLALTRPELPLCPGSSANLGECVIGEPPTWLRSLAWHRGSGLQRNSSDFRRLNRMRSLLPRSFAISLTCPRRSLLECVRVSTTTSAEPSRGLSDRELFELSTNELRHLALGRRTRNTLR